MRRLYLGLFALVITGVVSAQRIINAPNVEKRDVKNFHSIFVATGVELILTQSTEEAVAVSALTVEDRNRINTVVENGVLRISYDYNLWKLLKSTGDKKLRAYVSIVNIEKITGASGARVKLEGGLKSAEMALHFSSGATFEGKVDAGVVEVEQNSGSRVNISGTAKDLSYDGSSGSRFMGYDLVVNNCDARTNSGARAEITVEKELSARVSSGGQVYYRGSGVIKNIRSGSGGQVSRG